MSNTGMVMATVGIVLVWLLSILASLALPVLLVLALIKYVF